jgi:hypothetical protein
MAIFKPEWLSIYSFGLPSTIRTCDLGLRMAEKSVETIIKMAYSGQVKVVHFGSD